MITAVAILLTGYVLILAGMFFFQRNLLYHPDTSLPDPVNSGVAEMSAESAETSDGLHIVSWYAKGKPELPVVVYFHGNAGNIGSRGDKVRPFLDAGFGVLLVGYRGYGGNSGKPSQNGLLADARASLGILQKNGGSERPLVFYGESLGTALATMIATERAAANNSVRALILEAPFTSVSDAARYYYPFLPVRWLLQDTFEQKSYIARVSSPVLVFHGEQDKTMPIRFGKALFEMAQMPKQAKWYPQAGHNDLFDYGAAKLSIDFIQSN